MTDQTPERSVCSASKRGDKDHCDHSWSHDQCCWCGKTWGGDGAIGQLVVHLPSGRKGNAETPYGDLVLVDWPGGGSSRVDHADLRTFPLGRRL